MENDIIRKKFIEVFGNDKYVEFVLSLYESFPKRDRLFFWQEQLLIELSKYIENKQLIHKEIYSIFNHCPIHDKELIKDLVPVINGNRYKSHISSLDEKKLFPLANVYALRDLDSNKYPDHIEILYCPNCRHERSINHKNNSR
jgi:hypothetical protein